MKVMVIGSRGQLGSDLKEVLIGSRIDAIFTESFHGKPDSEIVSFIKETSPDVVINCSAYTNVRKAESEREIAFRLNAYIPALMARTCREIGAQFITFSTDYVFGGNSTEPYKELSLMNPLNVYGLSKSMGESYIMGENPESCIIRTSWLYSAHGSNFVKMILDTAQNRSAINIVSNQIGTPTNSVDLAFAVTKILETPIQGIYHYSNEGVASWYDFAHSIVRMANLDCEVVPITETDDAVRRPKFTVLSKGKIKNDLGIYVPHWRDSLESFMELNIVPFLHPSP